MSRLRSERGFTSIELLIAATLSIVVLSATLAPLDGLWKTTRQNGQQNEQQDLTRRTVDQLANELRSAGGQDQLVEKAAATDIVFAIADPLSTPSVGGNEANVKRVRYCLSGTTLHRQEQTWTVATVPALPSTAACPDGAWTGTRTVATGIANGATPLFTYDTGVLADIKTVGLLVRIDQTTGQAPGPSELETAITLRNGVEG